MCHSRNDNSKKANKRGGGKQTEERKVEEQPAATSTVTDEEKLSTIYQHLHKYIYQQYKSGAFDNEQTQVDKA